MSRYDHLLPTCPLVGDFAHILVASTSQHAFSQHFTIIDTSLTTKETPECPRIKEGTVSAEIVFPDRATANQMVENFNGVMADGNKLAVYIIENAPAQGLRLTERIVGSADGASNRSGGRLTSRIGESAPPNARTTSSDMETTQESSDLLGGESTG